MLGPRRARELPDSVQGIIAARLDLLDPPEKQLLQNAAVLGKVFWRGGVEALGTDAPDELVQRLDPQGVPAQGARLVDRRRAGAGVPARARARRRLRAAAARRARREAPPAAEWIAATSASRPDLVAHHYLQALELAGVAGGDTATLAPPARAALRAAGDRAHVARRLPRRDRALPSRARARSRRGRAARLLGAVVATASASLDPDAKALGRSCASRPARRPATLPGRRTPRPRSRRSRGTPATRTRRSGTASARSSSRSGAAPDSSLARALAARARHLMLADSTRRRSSSAGARSSSPGAAGLEDIAVDALVTVGTARGNQGRRRGVRDSRRRARARARGQRAGPDVPCAQQHRAT